MSVVLGAFFSVFFGICCAVVAENKGRGSAGWFVIGALFGPLGLILALVSKRNTEKLEENALSAGEARRCPYCYELIRPEAIVCKHCGKDVDPLLPKKDLDQPIKVESSPEDAQVLADLTELRALLDGDDDAALSSFVKGMIDSGYDGETLVDVVAEREGIKSSDRLKRILHDLQDIQ